MSDATAFLEDIICDYIEANGLYVSLHTGPPTSLNEVTGGAYARRPIAYTRSGTEPTIMSNDATIEFAVATANWGTITHYAIMSASVGGNMLVRKAVTTPKEINIGDVARFLTGELDISVN